MLFSRRRPACPMSSLEVPSAEASISSSIVNEEAPHLDYDLRPLSVERLSHYIEPVVDEERFRVH